MFGCIMSANMAGVKGHLLKIIILLCVGWFLSGSVVETVDSWDSPRDEMQDVVVNAGGLATLFAAGVCLALAELRKLREKLEYSAHLREQCVCWLIHRPLALVAFEVPTPEHSPPIPLRI